MSKIEVTKEEYDAAQRAVALLQKLNGSPKARQHLERAVKAEFPDVVTEEERTAEVAKPYVEKLESLEKSIKERFEAEDKAKREAAEKAADAALVQSFMRLKDAGYTDEGLSKIAEIMKTRHVADPEAAAALYDRQNPKPPEPQPSAWEPQRWNIESDAVVDTKALFENPDKWADLETGRVLAEVRSAQAA